jgi:hypothetical protein
MELGRRARGDAKVLDVVADIIRSPDNRRLFVIGTFTVSLLAAAGLVASGDGHAQALVRKLSDEWSAGEREDFAWLMRESGVAWP